MIDNESCDKGFIWNPSNCECGCDNDFKNTKKILKIDKKSHKNIDIYYIGHIAMKDSDYVKINKELCKYYTWLLLKQMDTLKEKMEINI